MGVITPLNCGTTSGWSKQRNKLAGESKENIQLYFGKRTSVLDWKGSQ